MKLPIYPPKIRNKRNRERLVALLSRLLIEQLNEANPNAPRDQVILSRTEAEELRSLIEEVLSEKEFFFGLAFVDGLIGRNKYREENLREIYLSERKKHGYSRALSSSQWHQFLTRLGLNAGDLSTLVRAANKMTFSHFQRMEDKLFSSLDIPHSVRHYLSAKVLAKKDEIEDLRERASNFSANQAQGIADETKRLLEFLAEDRDTLSSNQIAGITIVTANTSVLFSTRDWSVAGTMSTIAGGLTMAAGK